MRKRPVAAKKRIAIENETLAERKVRLALGSRGKTAETKVQEVLIGWQSKDRTFDFDRLLDSRSAGKIVAAQVADFLLFFQGGSATLEVKQIKKGYRLPKKSFPQHPRMLRRELAGSKGFLITFTEEDNFWRVVRVTNMELNVPSWKLNEVGFARVFADVEQALGFLKFQVLK